MQILNNSEPKVLVSAIDRSINHVYPDGSEFRLVRRDGYDTIYLSSHTGCNQGCAMCHLTANGDTDMKPLARAVMAVRAHELLRQSNAKRVHFAFMAKGEALLNPAVDSFLLRRLISSANADGRIGRVLLSTIFPKAFADNIAEKLIERFLGFQPTIYWSLYHVLDANRNYKMVPKAAPIGNVLKGLAQWQLQTDQIVVIHHALIKGFNDRYSDAEYVVAIMQAAQITYRVNLVRLNAPPGSPLEEADDDAYDTHRHIYGQAIGYKNVQVKPRVGPDVMASCGMFVAR